MRKMIILAVTLSCSLLGATRTNAQIKVFINTSALAVNGPEPCQTVYLASVLLPADTLNVKNRTGDVAVSGTMDQGYYPQNQTATLLVNLCDVPNCTGTVTVTVAQVNVTQIAGFPSSWRASSANL